MDVMKMNHSVLRFIAVLVLSLTGLPGQAFDSSNIGSTDVRQLMEIIEARAGYDPVTWEVGNGLVYVFCDVEDQNCKIGVARHHTFRARNREVAASPSNAHLALEPDTVSVVRGLTRTEAEVVETRAHQFLAAQHAPPEPGGGSTEIFAATRRQAETAIDRATLEVLELRALQLGQRQQSGQPDRQAAVDAQVEFWTRERVTLRHDRTSWALVSDVATPLVDAPSPMPPRSRWSFGRALLEAIKKVGDRRSHAISSVRAAL